MLDQDITITKQLEDSRFDRSGTRTAIVRVEFLVGDHGPFVERFPRDGFTADQRDTALNAFAREVRTS